MLDLKDANGETESKDIGSWKLDQITEFVKQKLVAAAPTSNGDDAHTAAEGGGDSSGDEL